MAGGSGRPDALGHHVRHRRICGTFHGAIREARKTTLKLADVSFAGTSSAWVKDGNRILRVQTGEVDRAFGGVSVFELDGPTRLRSIQRAARISVADPGRWRLHNVATSRFEKDKGLAARRDDRPRRASGRHEQPRERDQRPRPDRRLLGRADALDERRRATVVAPQAFLYRRGKLVDIDPNTQLSYTPGSWAYGDQRRGPGRRRRARAERRLARVPLQRRRLRDPADHRDGASRRAASTAAARSSARPGRTSVASVSLRRTACRRASAARPGRPRRSTTRGTIAG